MDVGELERYRRRVVTRSAELSYLDVGDGPVALFVHGIGVNANLWRHVIAGLAAERRCIALDLPMHGQSPVSEQQDLSIGGFAELVEDFRLALEVGSVDLVANDMGGAIAQVFAVRYRENLRTLTLTNCDTQDNFPPDAFLPMLELVATGELAPLWKGLLEDLDRARGGVYGMCYEHPELVSDDTLRGYIEPVVSTERHGRQFERMLAESQQTSDLLDIEPQLKQLDVPTLVVWGTGDVFFGQPRWAHWLRDTIPGVREVIEVDGARLFFPDERPNDLIPHLRRHWAQHAN